MIVYTNYFLISKFLFFSHEILTTIYGPYHSSTKGEHGDQAALKKYKNNYLKMKNSDRQTGNKNITES
jgi:hypothetical protein